MPEITDITAIRVVVARMIPSSVRKLRSLLPRSAWRALFTASQNDAWVFIQTCDGRAGERLARIRLDPLHYRPIEPQTMGGPADKPQVAAGFRGNHPDARVLPHLTA